MMLATAPYPAPYAAAAAHPNEDVCTAGCRTTAVGAVAADKEEGRRGLRRPSRHRRDQCYCCRQRFFLVVAASAPAPAPSPMPEVELAEPKP
ncbi:hypothetical protein PG996_004445 [Apiospora saccharicola]|uniref:Uncharacterized protein n=1 Tax=Apiospora saccharicola TaxID=335842 RepID=A0ABR1W6Z7_9PEZI